MASEISRSGQFSANLDAESLGAAVRRSRKSHGLTQSQLAGLAGTGLRFVSELERGKANVALNKVLAVLAVLGLRLRAVEVDSWTIACESNCLVGKQENSPSPGLCTVPRIGHLPTLTTI